MSLEVPAAGVTMMVARKLLPAPNGEGYCDEGYVVNESQTACVPECEQDSDCDNGYECVDNQCRVSLYARFMRRWSDVF